ncbi:MAG: hypothetical protein RTV31_03465 [Candidatus Thorarchaeota archaeon]
MTKAEDSDLELYGTRPGVIAFFMILISVIVALGILPMSIFFVSMIIAGGIEPMFIDDYLSFAYWPAVLVPLNICNIAYIRKMIHYYRGDCTRDFVIWVGLLSITLPTIFAIVLISMFTPAQSVLAISPIYLPFIFGIILMYKKPGPELISPWQGDLSDRSWWKLQRPDWWYRMFPSSAEDEQKESELELKSEWVETE